ncbi:uncharacterized protein GGS25DRAFT_474034 [Hypoxylon fragiforme]|uniref:uncharacterized protein n=1 Tax=Hypoxylon fragiforme TaxID=63214 RepID=UPI0020C71F5D|nr:uncharacterized protein GGS25DRAFT_474034 [Hypoxylon fragiforme]KAI2612164.1 hypothetical protein GGS25DRAFT_474034 [Hypoxylon fragiforme]
MAPLGRYALAALLALLAAIGFRATVIPLRTNGLGLVLRTIAATTPTGDNNELVDLLTAPRPFKRTYTGVAALDRHLSLLVGFFAAYINDAGAGWDATAFYVWGLGQFAAGWTALVLEGRRTGSKGRAIAWVGVVGVLFQNLGWTFVAPLYLALHLLTSPVARIGERQGKVNGGGGEIGVGDAARRSLFVYLWDLALLPMAMTIGFVLPTVFMSLPKVLGHSAATHYNWVAFWQPFPVWTLIILDVLHNACYFLLGSLTPQDTNGKPTTPGNGFLVAISGVYQYCLTISVATQLPVLLVAALPSPLRASLSSLFPQLAPFLSHVTFWRTFVPYPISASPSLADPLAYGPGDLAPLLIQFFQYDMYIGNAALLLWAFYLHVATAQKSLVRSLRVAVQWTLLGGPTGGAVALLWDRDEVVRVGESEVGGEDKTK